MTRPTVIALSPREHWPEPLGTLCARGLLAVRRVTSCHEAAAVIALHADAHVGILIDGEWLTRRELEMLNVIQRHAALPIWTMPASKHPKPGTDLGFLPWAEAARTFALLLHHASTPENVQGNSINPPLSPAAADAPDNAAAKTPEIPLASGFAARYDDLENPVLSRSEIQALLGTSD